MCLMVPAWAREEADRELRSAADTKDNEDSRSCDDNDDDYFVSLLNMTLHFHVGSVCGK